MAAARLPAVRAAMQVQRALVSYTRQLPANIISDEAISATMAVGNEFRGRIPRHASISRLVRRGRSVSRDLIAGSGLPWSSCWNIALRYSPSCYHVARWREAASTIILAASW